jgi:2-phosphosulfolactate phosphatase
MKINYLNLENCADARGTVIVIDVLRAFSTAAYAFGAGAESISLVSGVEEALNLRQQHPGWLVMGEEGGLPPKGFDFGNSPTQIRAQDLRGRHLIQRTSAGTQGVARSLNADVLLVASFVIASATVQYVLKSEPQELSFVITGGEKNEEDLACAEYLEALFQQRAPDPEPFIRRVYESYDAIQHLDPAQPEFPEEDLDFCTRIDIFPFALPVLREDGRPVLRPVLPVK